MGETVRVCPHCDKGKVRHRVESDEYHCWNCERYIDEPVIRDVGSRHKNGGGEMRSKLLKMDAEVNYE